MNDKSIKIEIVVCALVTAAFTNIYITQPILPVLKAEFDVTTVQVSFTVSFVTLGSYFPTFYSGICSIAFPYILSCVLVAFLLLQAGWFVQSQMSLTFL